MLKRKFYLDKIKKYLGIDDLIKVIVGQRRVGKSYLMRQIIDMLIQDYNVDFKNILYINFEVDYLKYPDIKVLNEFILNYKKNINGKLYLFFDEIQELTGWEKLLNSYRADLDFECEIFITGSNANLLSSDLSTYLSGRYILFYVYPFSYKEYIEYFKVELSQNTFIDYVNFSGISELYKLPDKEIQFDFLKSLKETIVLKDIVKRYNIKDIVLLERLFDFICGNIGNLFSVNSIVKKLKSIGINSNPITIGNYLQYLENAFLIHSVERYDLQGKRVLEIEKKYYLNDLGFNNFFFSGYDFGKGKHLENIVYIYLKKLGYKVYVGKIKNLEIDFVAERGNEIKYIQVAYLISDKEVFNREFGNLLKIQDNYEKIVLSLDPIIQDYRGIKHYKIYEWIKY